MIELMKFDMGGSACTLGAAKVNHEQTMFSLSLFLSLAPSRRAGVIFCVNFSDS